jgi:hypothetical protein
VTVVGRILNKQGMVLWTLSSSGLGLGLVRAFEHVLMIFSDSIQGRNFLTR